MLTETPSSSATRLVLDGNVPGASPREVTDHLTEPSLLTTWWPETAEIDPAGGYVFGWPAMDWTLRGAFTVREPGRRVAFTWNWDHEPDVPERTVDIVVAAVDDGTEITISHGDYGPGDEEERAGHVEGWQHFIGRLAEHLG
jgi:uncharacterized protein YndB with AHSA1/START domain